MFTHLTKTSWTTKVVLVLVAVALLGPISLVQAQGPPDDGSRVINFPTGDSPASSGPLGQTPATGYVPTDAQGQVDGAPVVTDSGNPATTGGVTDTTSVPNQQIPDGVYGDSAFKGMLYSIVVNLFGSLITWAGWLLNWAINDFVIGFGGFFNTTGVGVAVNELWSLVRDFFNILFIFGFIWIGFQMILDSGNSRAKQTLVSLIMAALLVNFSLFISKFVVDFSNRLASEVAIAAFPADDSVFDSTENIGGNIRTQRVNVADTFFAHMGIAETLNADQAVINNTNAPWSYIFGSAIFYLIAAFVFAAGGVMLMIRFVALSIFMVLSPFMFLGWVFPGMQGWTSKYWKGFLGRAFYAPVYIVLLFFAGTILQNFFGTRGSMTNDFAFGIQSAGGQQTFNPLISILGAFALSCAFLIAAVQVAGKMSADGAGGVMRVGSNLAQRGRRAMTYLPRRGAQVAIGRGIGGSLERLEQSNSRFAGAARRTMAVASLGALDARGRQEAAKQARGAKFGTSYSTADNLQNAQTQQQLSTRRKQRGDDDEAIKAAEKAGDSATAAQLDAAEEAANRYTEDELTKMDAATRNKVIKHLKANTVAKLLDSDKLSVDDKASVSKEYKEKVTKQVFENGEVISEEFEKLSDKQLEVLGTDFANENAHLFSESQMEGFKKNDSMTERQKDKVKELRKDKRMVFAHSPAGRAELFNGRKIDVDDDKNPILNAQGKQTTIVGSKPKKASEIAGLPYEAFIESGNVTPEAEKAMSADLLKQIARNANQGKPTMSDTQRRDLANAVIATPSLMNNPGIANYLNSNKGKEDFLLPLPSPKP
jgi:hypothetical protein